MNSGQIKRVEPVTHGARQSPLAHIVLEGSGLGIDSVRHGTSDFREVREDTRNDIIGHMRVVGVREMKQRHIVLPADTYTEKKPFQFLKRAGWPVLIYCFQDAPGADTRNGSPESTGSRLRLPHLIPALRDQDRSGSFQVFKTDAGQVRQPLQLIQVRRTNVGPPHSQI